MVQDGAYPKSIYFQLLLVTTSSSVVAKNES